MQDSNQTLRFPRTSREAFGYSVEIEEHHRGDRAVGYIAAFAAGFLICLIFTANQGDNHASNPAPVCTVAP